ncbi:MAG: iron-containing redox enzyme family protein, partial [Candidatus Methylomirabilaceae bacterium]
MEALLAIRKRVFDELLQTRALRQVMAETMDRAGYIRYLLNVFHYAQYSPVVMSIAASHCLRTHPELASYLLRHAQEETGHDVWAAEDLRDLGVGEEEFRASRPVSSCAALIGYTHYVAGFANPIGIFGWMYVLEAV